MLKCQEIFIFFCYLTCVTPSVCLPLQRTLAQNFKYCVDNSHHSLSEVSSTWYVKLWCPREISHNVITMLTTETSVIHKNASIIIFSAFEEEDQSAYLTVFVCICWEKNVFVASCFKIYLFPFGNTLSCIVVFLFGAFCSFIVHL